MAESEESQSDESSDIHEATSPENSKSFRTPNSGIYNTQIVNRLARKRWLHLNLCSVRRLRTTKRRNKPYL